MTKIFENIISTIKKEKLLSISNLLAMTVTFIVLGLFIEVIIYSQTALKMLEQQAQITVFFKDDVPEERIMELRAQFQGDGRILDVTYVSKEDAFEIFKEINKDEPVLLESISANILPASLEVKSKNLSSLDELAEEYQVIDGVEEVKYFEDVIERFRYWSSVIYVVGIVTLFTLFVISYSVIIVTLRTTINNKGIELEILKLVGATDRYVKKPLMYQGIFFGGLSALIASLFLILGSVFTRLLGVFGADPDIYLASLKMDSLVFSVLLSVVLLLSGILLGYLGSLTAVKKYLKY
ncbi:MAG: Efflux ABC transporter, permease protein [candidate division WWE3 bacterium GW2011_GWA1_41_8]|uniref:Cell division protein FtsX n=2 Tax=Katanobacteria TaxID=422282 RepID=A0A0G1A6I0_UNCKA|nr:MAG: Efflux ABC transporter, permease protein [candidate division WWE3 bacterium GW2011_GWB1_41_6]KKS20943.1 MAG: Efflux ABC transporter, permease protein [candidate division WWE3 bacterium GW2011_GWA1_41_8]